MVSAADDQDKPDADCAHTDMHFLQNRKDLERAHVGAVPTEAVVASDKHDKHERDWLLHAAMGTSMGMQAEVGSNGWAMNWCLADCSCGCCDAIQPSDLSLVVQLPGQPSHSSVAAAVVAVVMLCALSTVPTRMQMHASSCARCQCLLIEASATGPLLHVMAVEWLLS